MARLEDAPAAGEVVRRAADPAPHRRARDSLGSSPGEGGSGAPEAGIRGPADKPAYRARLSIHVLVLALSIALVAPAIGFLAYVISQQHEAQHRQATNRGTQLATDIAGRLEQELESLGTILAVFASSGWLEANELELLHRRASRALAGTGRHLIVLDENLVQLLNTRVPFGTPLGKTGNTDAAQEALESGTPAISDIFIGHVADAPVFNALRPVTLPDGRERVLILTRNAASLAEVIGTPETQDGWDFVVLDGSGQVVTRRAAIQPANQPVPPSCMRETPGPQVQEMDDSELQVFLRPVNGSLWRVCAWSASGILPAGGESWSPLFTAAAAWIGVAILTAVMLSALISRSIARTARIGATLGSGGEVPYVPSIVAEVDDVRRTLAEAAAERVRNDRRLELLLREAAHRARNQIALAVSLVDLSSRGAGTAAELKTDLSSRLRALGRSIDALTARAPDTARLGDLVTAQLAMFLDDRGERLEAGGEEVLISERAAQSLSLVLHELATNASKYGAWASPEGTVTVRWHVTTDSLVIDWSEAGAPGAGIPFAGDTPEGSGFGTKLMKTLVEKGLNGQLDRSFGAAGFSCRMVLPRESVAPQRHEP